MLHNHSIRLEKISNSKKNMTNDGVMPIRGRVKKWQLAYFRPIVGYFGHIFSGPRPE